jgi:hypothetical protein
VLALDLMADEGSPSRLELMEPMPAPPLHELIGQPIPAPPLMPSPDGPPAVRPLPHGAVGTRDGGDRFLCCMAPYRSAAVTPYGRQTPRRWGGSGWGALSASARRRGVGLSAQCGSGTVPAVALRSPTTPSTATSSWTRGCSRCRREGCRVDDGGGRRNGLDGRLVRLRCTVCPTRKMGREAADQVVLTVLRIRSSRRRWRSASAAAATSDF